MEFILGAVILALIVRDFLRERASDRRLDQQAEFAERVVNRMALQAEESRGQVSEMATRIQHPEIYRPDLSPETTEIPPPVFDDEYDLVGKVVEDAENGAE